jgi:hypothetical protein
MPRSKQARDPVCMNVRLKCPSEHQRQHLLWVELVFKAFRRRSAKKYRRDKAGENRSVDYVI